MATIKFVLKSNQPKKDGSIPILLRVIADRKTKYISTGYAVKEHQFKEGTENWVVKHPDAALINAALELKRSEVAEQSYRADIENKRLDIAALGKKKRVTGTFFAAVTARLDNLEARNQAAMYEKLHAKFKIIKAIWRQDVYLEELSKHHVDKFISARIANKIHVNTIKKELSYFSTVLSEVEHKGVDYFRRAQKNLVTVKGKKQRLTAEDIALMEKTNMYGMTEVARDMR